jgi:hypothetical protein
VRRRLVSLALLTLLAPLAACESADTRPAYAYSAGPAPRTSASRLPAPTRRSMAPTYVAPPVAPRRAST